MLSHALLIIHNLPKDIKIICSDRNFFVNKTVLESSSDYFKCMFNGWKEETTKEINFTGFHSEAVDILIQHIECKEIQMSTSIDITHSCYRLAQMTLLTNLQKSMHDRLKVWTKNIAGALRILEIVDLDEDIQKYCFVSIRIGVMPQSTNSVSKKINFSRISPRVKDLILKELFIGANLIE